MSILVFIVYAGNLHKEETFGTSSSSTSEEDHEAWQESRHAMNMTPNDPRTETSTCKSLVTQPENSEAWIARIQALTMKETTSKANMQVHTNKESREKQPGRKPGPNWVETSLGRPNPLRARFGTPFDLAAIWTIYSPLAKSHAWIDSSSSAEEQRREEHRSGEERVEMVD
jgi:hypothetical protein